MNKSPLPTGAERATTNRSQRLLTLLLGSSATLLALGLLHSGQVQAAASIDWQRYNTQVLEQHIQPGYRHFAEASQALYQQSAALCLSPDSANLSQAQQAYRNSLQAWEGISHIQFGPIQMLMRNYAIQFWPDRKNIGQRQLATALQIPQQSTYDAEFFREASVSIKGLPALERLLFDDNALQRLQHEPRYCELTEAIAGYMQTTADALQQEWQQVKPSTDSASNDDDSGDGDAAELPQFSLDLMKSLVEPIENIRDSKLLAVLGQSREAARPMRAESWRSGQSLANIRSNLAAARALYLGGSTDRTGGLAAILKDQAAAELDQQIQQQFQQLQQQLAQQPDALTEALTSDEGYATLQGIATTFKALDQSLNDAMQHLNIQLGFNSRDGD